MSVDLSSISDSFVTSFQQLDKEGGVGVVGECPPPVSNKKAVFGRAEEITFLLQAYQTLLRTKQPQTVIVHGKSGSGKTALVDTLLGPVFDTSGYFVSGKYFQNEAVQEPFSAIMAAFSDLCDLVVQSDDFDKIKKKHIAKALHAHARLLVKAITNLTSLTGTVDEVELEVSSIPKFKIACKAFLHTLACDDHPIVIFLDDVQWADEGSVALIQMFLQDAELTNVMLILAYRDEQSECVTDIMHNARALIDIGLSDLDADGVLLMVNFIMGAATEEIEALSDLVANRTSGNPYHVITFLETIECEGLLTYESATSSWLFDVDEIRQSIMVSETLADLLTRKIGRISGEIKESLKVASLLGYQFDESMLQSVVCTVLERQQVTFNNEADEKSDSTMCATRFVLSSLSEGVKEGFIEKTSSGYQFTHDKLQSAFQSLIGDMEENELHTLIGEAFLTERAEERSYIYKAAVHLNAAPTSTDHHERARLAWINLDAARYCVEISAFGRATTALEHGIECLNIEERWSEEYSPLTLEIMLALARNQLIVGEFEDCKETIREALCHRMPIEMKINFQFIGLRVRISANEGVESMFGRVTRALETLGIKIPRKVTIRHILAKFAKVKWMLKKKTDEAILNLPLTEDLLISQAVKLLVTMCSHYSLKERHDLAILFALMAIELTLKNGLSLHSPGAFTFYGIAELVIGNRARAYRFGKLAMIMMNNMDSREADASVVSFATTTLTFRKDTFKEIIESLHLAADSGFKFGDVVFAAFSTIQCHTIRIHLGSNLAVLESDIRESYATIAALGQDALLLWFQPAMQLVLNMQLDVINWDNISVLSGEVMNEGAFLDESLKRNDRVLIMVMYLRKARIACDFGQFELAESYFQSMNKVFGKDPVEYSNAVPPYCWDVARIHISLYHSSGQRRHLKRGRKFMKLLQQLDKDGCPDAGARLVFLEAQKASVRKRPLNDGALRETYQHALNHLAKTDYFVLEGLLSENAGFDFAKRGLRREAKTYFERALRIYEHDWGAQAKYNQLCETMLFWMESDEVTGCPAGGAVLSGLCINVDSNQ